MVMSGIAVFMCLLLLWSGLTVMNSLIYQFGTEILTEKLNTLIHSIDSRYASIISSEDRNSSVQLQEIKDQALENLARFRYKDSGEVFVIHRDKTILISKDFKNQDDKNFAAFYNLLQREKEILQYRSGTDNKLAVFRYFRPWESFIGISINRQELFALTNLFIGISLILLAAFLLSIILFAGVIQRVIITPLIRLTHFANQISSGNYDASLTGKYILELGDLKNDMLQMASHLSWEMNQAASQLQLLRKREAKLDNALSALRKSEKKYRAIYNAPTDAIFILDLKNGRILDANKAMLMMFGYKENELGTLTFAQLSSGKPPYTEQEANKRMKRAVEKGSQFFEWLARKSNGECFWVEISLRLTDIEKQKQLIAIVRDVHIRKTAERELATEKEQLSVTLRSIGDGVITTDIQGRIILMNRVAENLTGWRQVEAVGRIITDVFHTLHPDTEKPTGNPVEKILSAGQIVEPTDEIILVTRDGKKRNIMNSGAPIMDMNRIVSGAVIVFRDITGKKKLEEEFFKINKLESVGVLAGGIAHDFNNILTAILGNVSLAEQHLEDKELTDHLLKKMKKAALRAQDLTSQLITFSHGGRPVLKTTFLDPLIRDSAEYILHGSNVKVSYDIPVDLWPVEIDPQQINQVIQNLVLNARQAMKEKGNLEITCRNIENCNSSNEIDSKQCVRITITDNGCGITAEALPKIFDPYFTTKNDGSGLGLSICHSIIKKHGAHISVQSVPESGTTFTVTLPVIPDKNAEQPSQERKDMTISYQQKRILIMDDDQMIVELSKQILEHLGHEVVASKDGETALEYYQKAMIENNPFDIVIMDLTIPGGMGGKETIKELMRIDPDARAVVSSGYSHDPVMAEYWKYGFKAVIVKPYQVEDLKKVIQETLQSKTADNL